MSYGPFKSAVTIAAIAAAAVSVTGCAGVRQAIGADKVAPDEFKVVTKAPLVMPPDYQLRPPRPGAPRPQELDPDGQARAAVFGQDVGRAATDGEKALIAKAGADAVDPAVRAQIDLEAGGIVRKPESFANRVLSFGSDAKPEAATPLNPETESLRLAEQETIRKATGGGAVVIQRKDTTKSKLPGL
ncbi:MAG: DUF3035 domain-containing protein [Caulobacterales bacterium]